MTSELDVVMKKRQPVLRPERVAPAILVALAVVSTFFVAGHSTEVKPRGGGKPGQVLPSPAEKAEDGTPQKAPAAPEMVAAATPAAPGAASPESQLKPSAQPKAGNARERAPEMKRVSVLKPAGISVWLILGLALLLSAIAYGTYRLVQGLSLHRVSWAYWKAMQEYRYIRAHQVQLATREAFPRVKAAWLDLLEQRGLPRQPVETLVQHVQRAPAEWRPFQETLRLFAEACDAETYSQAVLSDESRGKAIQLYLGLFSLLPRLKTANRKT